MIRHRTRSRLSTAKFLVAAVVLRFALPAPAQSPAPGNNETFVAYQKSYAAALDPWCKAKVTIQEGHRTLLDLLALLKERGLEVGLAAECVESSGDDPIGTGFDGENGDRVLEMIHMSVALVVVVDAKGKLWLTTEEHAGSCAAPGWRDALLKERAEYDHLLDDTPRVEPASYAKIRESTAAKKVTLSAKDSPLPDVLKDLSRQTELDVQVDFSDPDLETLLLVSVTVDARDRPLKEVLDGLCASRKLEWCVDLGFVVVGRPARVKEMRESYERDEKARLARLKAETDLFARTTALAGENLSAAEIASRLEKELGVPCRTDLFALDYTKRWSFPAARRTVGEVVAALAEDDKLYVYFREGVLWILEGYTE